MKNDKKKGIVCIIMAAFCFALMNLFVNKSGNLPVYEKAFFRNVVAILVSGATLSFSKEKFSIGKGNFKFIFGRAFFGTLGIFTNFYAISNLDISDASMLNKLSPFFSMIFSVWILKEKANFKEWLIVAIAFIGAVLVVKPSFDLTCMPALIGFFSGLFAGLAYTFVRKLGGRGERGAVIVFYFSVFSTLVTIPFMLIHYVPLSTFQLVMLLGAGLSATGGQYAITAAYQYAPAKEISVFDYSQVIFAAVLGFVFLDQIADVYSYIGYVVIISMAILKWFIVFKKEGSKNV